jgi:hypothetical protein
MMLITFGIHLYEICTKNVFLICLVYYFQNCERRKSWGQLHSLLLKIEGGGNSFAPLFGIKILRKNLFYFSMEAYIVHLAKGIRIFGQGYALKPSDSYGASEFMSVRIFSCLSVSVFSFLGIRNFLSAIKYLSFCHVILVYLYHILLQINKPLKQVHVLQKHLVQRTVFTTYY